MHRKLQLALLISPLLAGCTEAGRFNPIAKYFGNGVTTTTIMPANLAAIRDGHSVVNDSFVRSPHYIAPSSCRYSLDYKLGQDRSRSGHARISVNFHAKGLFTVVDLAGSQSSALYDRLGNLSEFNLVTMAGQRFTSRTGNIAQPVGSGAWSGTKAATAQFNFALTPIYLAGPWSPGRSVAMLRNLAGDLVGEYRYRGRVMDTTGLPGDPGRAYMAIDILMSRSGENYALRGAVIAGFAIVDSGTMLPVQFALADPLGNFIYLSNAQCSYPPRVS